MQGRLVEDINPIQNKFWGTNCVFGHNEGDETWRAYLANAGNDKHHTPRSR